jgi:hypothetical protein
MIGTRRRCSPSAECSISAGDSAREITVPTADRDPHAGALASFTLGALIH